MIEFAYLWAGILIGVVFEYMAMRSNIQKKEALLIARENYLHSRGPRQWMLDENIYAGIAHAQSNSVIEYDLGSIEIRNDGESPVEYWMKFDVG